MIFSGVSREAPKLDRFVLDEINDFVEKREAFEKAVRDKNVVRPHNQKIIPDSICGSIHPSQLKYIAEMELDCKVEELTDYSVWGLMKRKCNQCLKG